MNPDDQQIDPKQNFKKCTKHSADKSLSTTQIDPSPVTAKKFLMPKPLMRHKESMKLGKDILNTLATAAKKQVNTDDQ